MSVFVWIVEIGMFGIGFTMTAAVKEAIGSGGLSQLVSLYGRSVIWTHHNPAVSRNSEARILQRIALLLGL